MYQRIDSLPRQGFDVSSSGPSSGIRGTTDTDQGTSNETSILVFIAELVHILNRISLVIVAQEFQHVEYLMQMASVTTIWKNVTAHCRNLLTPTVTSKILLSTNL